MASYVVSLAARLARDTASAPPEALRPKTDVRKSDQRRLADVGRPCTFNAERGGIRHERILGTYECVGP